MEMKLDYKTYNELPDELLDKLNLNRLFGLRDKMSIIISKFNSDYEMSKVELDIELAKAIAYKAKILERLNKFKQHI
jgi:hypothetical protein